MEPLKCDVCGTELKGLYCTVNVCQTCCEAGKCPCKDWCVIKHPEFKNVPLWRRLQIIAGIVKHP